MSDSSRSSEKSTPAITLDEIKNIFIIENIDTEGSESELRHRYRIYERQRRQAKQFDFSQAQTGTEASDVGNTNNGKSSDEIQEVEVRTEQVDNSNTAGGNPPIINNDTHNLPPYNFQDNYFQFDSIADLNLANNNNTNNKNLTSALQPTLIQNTRENIPSNNINKNSGANPKQIEENRTKARVKHLEILMAELLPGGISAYSVQDLEAIKNFSVNRLRQNVTHASHGIELGASAPPHKAIDVHNEYNFDSYGDFAFPNPD